MRGIHKRDRTASDKNRFGFAVGPKNRLSGGPDNLVPLDFFSFLVIDRYVPRLVTGRPEGIQKPLAVARSIALATELNHTRS